MGRVLTNNFQLSAAREESLGVLPAQPVWDSLEPNAISTFGSTITTVSRDPISKLRQRRKGAVTDLDSAVEFDSDLIRDHFILFAEGFLFSAFAETPRTFEPSAVASGAFTVASGGDLPADTLVFSRGFDVPANNGFAVVGSGSTGTSIVVASAVLEANPPDKASVEVCGVRGATGDIEIDAAQNLISTVLDFTTLGIVPGQGMFIGGTADTNKFADVANSGYVRVASVSANEIVLDKRSNPFTEDDGSTKEIDLFFGRFLKNVSVDDPLYQEISYQFEGEYPNLANPSGDEYEYAKGNFCNTLGISLPLTDKATTTFGFIGTDTQPPTGDRATNADTARTPIQTSAFNTSADCARLRIQETDETGLTTDFKSLTLTLNNNVSPEKVLCTLGARFMNTGNFEVDIEAQLLFTSGAVVSAIRENRTLTMDFAVTNDDGGIYIDIPSMTLGGGGKDYPINESILINTTAQAFVDPILGSSIGITLFPYLP